VIIGAIKVHGPKALKLSLSVALVSNYSHCYDKNSIQITFNKNTNPSLSSSELRSYKCTDRCSRSSRLRLLDLCSRNSTRPNWWAWDGVRRNRRSNIEIVKNARIFGRVECCSKDSRWLGRTITRNREIETEWVILRSICLRCCMQSDDFVSQNVVSWSNCGRNFHDPREIVRDHDVCRPATVFGLRVHKRQLIDLKEFKFCFVDCFTGAVTVC